MVGSQHWHSHAYEVLNEGCAQRYDAEGQYLQRNPDFCANEFGSEVFSQLLVLRRFGAFPIHTELENNSHPP